MKTIIGIDWSEKKHCVHFYNEAGALLSRFEIEHSLSGFIQLERRLAKVNPEPTDCLIAIETNNTLLVDFLHSRNYTLYVLAPSLVKHSRERQGSSGAKDDDRDAPGLTPGGVVHRVCQAGVDHIVSRPGQGGGRDGCEGA